ncbi:MAG: NosD domain-containing protein, partial [Promethearchaeota archaeon]
MILKKDYTSEIDMKSSTKSNLIILGTLLALSLIFTINLYYIKEKYDKSLGYSDDFTSYGDKLHLSKVSGKIHINNNWTDTKNAEICTGNGTFSDPYVIEDLEINSGGLGNCILIENSNVHFKIENCTLNAGHTGIRLNNVINGKLILNNCSFNDIGIALSGCNNITISGNLANNNSYYGIHLMYSNNNSLSGNIANNNLFGIYLHVCDDNILSGNTMNKCGLIIYGGINQLSSHDIDNTNLVNGKPLYYYKNEVNLLPDDFLDAGQVILVNCNYSLISNLDISFNNIAVSLYYCSNNTISGNIACNNRDGIYLHNCDDNIISGNTVSDSSRWGIYLHTCDNNTISGNTANNNDRGIYVTKCDNSTISGNTATNNSYWGICVDHCDNNTISENTANNNDRGIYLAVCDNNIISGNTANNNSFYGIELYFSDFNTVSENTANYNFHGIELYHSNFNIISKNTLIRNFVCIYEENCIGNTFNDNGDCTHGQRSSGVPIEMIIVILVITGGATLGLTILLIIRHRKKR